jgi:hypothetical protein
MDQFTYDASVGAANFTGTVTITVTETEKAPLAAPFTAFTVSQESTGNLFQLNATDGNNAPMTYSIVTPPVYGIYSMNSTTGVMTYSPFYGFTGNDTLTFTASDGRLQSDLGKIQISVN